MVYRKKKYAKKSNRGFRQRRKSYKRKYGRGTRTFKKAVRQLKYGVLKTGEYRTFPTKASSKLIYSTNVNLAQVSAGVPYSYTFAMNDMYDPDVTGGGSQPTGYDDLSILYSKWLVYGSKISITAFTTVGEKSGHVFLWPDTQVATNYSSVTEDMLWRNPNVKYRFCSNPNAKGYTKMSMYCPVKRFTNVKDLEDQSQFWGSASISGSPSTIYYWNIVTFSDYASAGMRVVVKIKYYAKWWNLPKEVLPIS